MHLQMLIKFAGRDFSINILGVLALKPFVCRILSSHRIVQRLIYRCIFVNSNKVCTFNNFFYQYLFFFRSIVKFSYKTTANYPGKTQQLVFINIFQRKVMRKQTTWDRFSNFIKT